MDLLDKGTIIVGFAKVKEKKLVKILVNIADFLLWLWALQDRSSAGVAIQQMLLKPSQMG